MIKPKKLYHQWQCFPCSLTHYISLISLVSLFEMFQKPSEASQSLLEIKRNSFRALPWWSSGWRPEFNPWSGNWIPYAATEDPECRLKMYTQLKSFLWLHLGSLGPGSCVFPILGFLSSRLTIGSGCSWWLLDHRCSSPCWVLWGLTSSQWRAPVADDGDILVYRCGRKYSISRAAGTVSSGLIQEMDRDKGPGW